MFELDGMVATGGLRQEQDRLLSIRLHRHLVYHLWCYIDLPLVSNLLLLLGPLDLLVLLDRQLEVVAVIYLQLLVGHSSVSWCVLASL